MDTTQNNFNRRYRFTPKNPDKCKNLIDGKSWIVVKSQIEFLFAKQIDKDPSVVLWGYEIDVVPYRNEEDLNKNYMIDFSLHLDNFEEHWIEIKMADEVLNPSPQNLAKWRAAKAFCEGKKASFVVFPNIIAPFMAHTKENLIDLVEIDPDTDEPLQLAAPRVPISAISNAESPNQVMVNEPTTLPKKSGFFAELIPKKIRNFIKI